MSRLLFVLHLLMASCFFLAMIGVGSRINLVAAGLFCWSLTFFL